MNRGDHKVEPNKENIERWAEALESGEYEQCYGEPFGGQPNQACAVGVALLVAGSPVSRYARVADFKHASDFYGLSFNGGPKLKSTHPSGADLPVVFANDYLKQDFWTIAQRIRETYLKDEPCES